MEMMIDFLKFLDIEEFPYTSIEGTNIPADITQMDEFYAKLNDKQKVVLAEIKLGASRWSTNRERLRTDAEIDRDFFKGCIFEMSFACQRSFLGWTFESFDAEKYDDIIMKKEQRKASFELKSFDGQICRRGLDTQIQKVLNRKYDALSKTAYMVIAVRKENMFYCQRLYNINQIYRSICEEYKLREKYAV